MGRHLYILINWITISDGKAPIYRSTGEDGEGQGEKKERSEEINQALVKNQTLVPPEK